MGESPQNREADFLRERAETLRKMAAVAMPASISAQLLEIAAQLDIRAANLEGSQTFEGGDGL
jgi:hypothetical protein